MSAGLRRPPRRSAGQLHAHRGVIRRDGRRRWPCSRATWTRPLGFVLEGGYDLARWRASVAATIEGALDAPRRRPGRAGRARRPRPRPLRALVAARLGPTPRRGGGREEFRRRAPSDPLPGGARDWRQKEGRRASTAPLPPASKAPQRLALPPGSLVCNGRRKGDRRGAVVAMREAMALHAVRPEAMELPPAPAGLTRPDALGRDWPLIDGAPALDALARRPWEVSAATLVPREACRACGAPGASARPDNRPMAPIERRCRSVAAKMDPPCPCESRTRLVRDVGRLGLGSNIAAAGAGVPAFLLRGVGGVTRAPGAVRPRPRFLASKSTDRRSDRDARNRRPRPGARSGLLPPGVAVSPPASAVRERSNTSRW